VAGGHLDGRVEVVGLEDVMAVSLVPASLAAGCTRPTDARRWVDTQRNQVSDLFL
jgi:hypothetical protein